MFTRQEVEMLKSSAKVNMAVANIAAGGGDSNSAIAQMLNKSKS